MATVNAVHGALRIVAVNGSAQAVGICPDLPLADARALYPALQIHQADFTGEAQTLKNLSIVCGRYTPWTAIDTDGGLRAGSIDGSAGLWLDVSGCTHLFGGEQALLHDLLLRLDKAGFAARVAVADTPGAAWALARYATTKDSSALIAPQNNVRMTLSPLPTAALRLEGDILEHFDRIGLRHVGDLLDIPRIPLTNRFGESVIRRIDQALGRTKEPLSPRRTPIFYDARLAFAEPIGRIEDVRLLLERLLATLCRKMSQTDHGVRRLELRLYRVDNTIAKTAIGTSRPSRDAGHLARLFQDKIANLNLGFGVEVVALVAVRTEQQHASQIDLEGCTTNNLHEDTAQLVDRLSGRFGPRRVTRMQPNASYLPERARRRIPATKFAATMKWQENKHIRAQPRPLQLLIQPALIAVVAPVPDGPPVMFRWRKQQHRVYAADGPERIAPEWWDNEDRQLTPELRDYYRIEDTNGRRFWVFREGLFRPDKAPNWYLHGFFA